MVDHEKSKIGAKPPRFIWLLRLLRRWIPPASRRERIYRWFVVNLKHTTEHLQDVWPGYAEKRYARWQAENEAHVDVTEESPWDSDSTDQAPRISVILMASVCHSPALQSSVHSIQSQIYQQWDLLVLLLDASEQTGTQLLESLPIDDERIHAEILREKDEGFLDLLDQINSDFLLLISQEDLLAPQALWEIACAVIREPNADVLYSDQDCFETGRMRRVQPWFKPDWSPELILSVNYLRPLIVRKSILVEIIDEDFRRNLDWWDLALRCVDKARAVVHVPKVLFHVLNSTRPNSVTQGKDAVVSHLARSGLDHVRALETSRGSLQAVWPTRGGLVSIVIPTRDHPEMLRKCIKGILHHTSYPNLQIIVVDNGSIKEETKDYYDHIQTDERVRIIQYNEPFNYSEANNLGAQHADGQHLLFLNDDVEVLDEGWLDEMARWSERDEIGAVGAKLLFPNGMIQHAGIVLGLGGHAGHVFRGVQEGESGPFGSTEWYRNYLAVTAACLMVPKEVFLEIDGFNVKYQLAFGDVDLCLRIRKAGYRLLYTPFARLVHYESVSRGRHIPTGDLIEAYNDFMPYIIEGDPSFSPNLSYRKLVPGLSARNEDRVEFIRQILSRRLAVE